LSQKSLKMGAKNFIGIFTNLTIMGENEKIKQGREDFFFTSLILTTVSDVYNVLHLDSSVFGPFR
jgi:hypothetical protein